MVIVEGAVAVTRKGRKINTLGRGDFIGEMALISGGPRTATVTTIEPTSLLAITDRQFWELLRQVPEMQSSVIKTLRERLQSNAV